MLAIKRNLLKISYLLDSRGGGTKKKKQNVFKKLTLTGNPIGEVQFRMTVIEINKSFINILLKRI